MSVYYIALLLILALAWPLCIHRPAKWKTGAYVAIVFSYLWFLATFREGIGFDYISYIEIFEEISAMEGLSIFGQRWEPGFVLLTKGIAMVTQNTVVMYGIYTLLILLPVAWFIYAYSKTPWLSAWMYVSLAFFYANMNFVRQSLACSVSLLGYKFLREKKPVPFILIVLVAASFHVTALVLIPVYFFCHIKLNKKWGIIYALATLTLFLTSGLLVDLFTDYFYTYYKNTYYLNEGFPLVFLIVPFFLFGACLALWPAWRKRDPDSDFLLNMMLYASIIWLFITRHFILERFSVYVYIYALIAVPAAISALRAPPEDWEKLAELQRKKAEKGTSKELTGQIRLLTQKVKDSEKYYWSAVVALLLLTAVYNEFGAYVNGFHNVFPYQSTLDWVNRFIKATF